MTLRLLPMLRLPIARLVEVLLRKLMGVLPSFASLAVQISV